MRPTFRHMDVDPTARPSGENSSSESSGDESEEPREVQVQFKRRESEKAQAARKKSHAYLQKQLDEEPWQYLSYLDQNVNCPFLLQVLAIDFPCYSV